MRIEYHAKSSDDKLHIVITTGVLNRCAKALKNKANATSNRLEYTTQILKALKKIPPEYGKLIYTRFFCDTPITQKQMYEMMGITYHHYLRLQREAYKALCKQMYDDALKDYYLQTWETQEVVPYLNESTEMFLSMKDLSSQVDSYELIHPITQEYNQAEKYLVNVKWSKWIRKLTSLCGVFILFSNYLGFSSI